MKTLSNKRWFFYLLPILVVLLFSGILLASETQERPLAQAGATASPTAEAEPTADPNATATPSAVDYAMYFNSEVQDADTCAMTVEDGVLVIDPQVTNPAVSCPSMFAWKLFLDAIGDEFWLNWSSDEYVWPAEPLPLCSADSADPQNCCSPDSLENPGYDDPDNPGLHCPYFPGDHLAEGDQPNTLESNPPNIAQDDHFTSRTPQDELDPGRVIRQEMAEIVFRNEPMFDYVFDNNIYHTDGLAAVFARSQANFNNQPPYRQNNTTGELVRFDFPVDAVMVKTNWLHEARAAELGLDDNPQHPYITMEINSSVTDNNGTAFEPGIHYLLGVHISSKDTPNWIWTTFEHVDNPGRCDMIGCNDAFGYLSPDEVADNQYRNYTEPHTRSDDLIIPSTVFDPALQYDGGEITPELAAAFEGLGIGSGGGTAAELPSTADAAWFSYRLKGTQVDWVDSNGRPTLLGNSVTEAGFVNSSSCITCHARAAVNEGGHPALGVFLSRLGEDGYPEGSVGLPDPDWYFTSSNNPAIQAVQTDFTWGILFANPLATPESESE